MSFAPLIGCCRGYLTLFIPQLRPRGQASPLNKPPCASETPLFDRSSINSFGNFVWVQGPRRDFPSLRFEALWQISRDRGALFTATGSRGVGLGPWFGGRASPNLNWPQTAHEQCQNSSPKLAPCFRRSWSMGLGPWSFARYGRIEALSRHAPRVRISFAPPQTSRVSSERSR